jgi:hypothetical protein
MERSSDSNSLQARGFAAFGLLLAYLVFSPLLVELGFPISNTAISLMDWQRILEILTIASVVLLLAPHALFLNTHRFVLPSFQFYGWFVFFALGACSSALSAIPDVAWLEWIWNLCWFLATVLLIMSSPPRNELQNAAITFVMGAMASYATLFFVTNSEALYSTDPILRLEFPGFNNLRVFSDYQTAILFFIPLAIGRMEGLFLWRFMAWAVAACYVALAFASGSRSLFFGQIAALLTLTFLLRGRCVQFLARQLRMWCFGFAAYILLFLLIPWLINGDGVTNALIRGSLSLREVLWKQAWSMMLENPFLGAGPMHFAVIQNGIAASPHNQILQLLAEWGLPATLIFIVLLGHFLSGKILFLQTESHKLQPFDREFSIATIAALFALIFQSFVSPVFNNPASQMLLSLFAVLCVFPSRNEQVIKKCFRQVKGRIFALLSILAVFMLGVFVIPSGFRIEERTACYIAHQQKIIYFMPRFWQQGEIYKPCEPKR